MSDSEEYFSEEIQPVCVLLPFCLELETDVFLKILRSVVARTRLDDHEIEALKAGMTEDMFYVKSNDLSASWKELDSKSQRTRQFKLLGFWATRNFPGLGKKLFGEVWRAAQGKTVEVLENSMMTADSIDILISRKMQLRIIELNVCRSTLDKIKHFVKTPIGIGQFNAIRISPKIRTFEIEAEYTERCWKALKFGQFSMDQQQICLRKPDGGRSKTMEQERGISSANNYRLVPVVKRARLEATTRAEERGVSVAIGSQFEHVAELPVANTTEHSTIESFRIALLEMRKEIGDITKLYNPVNEGPQMILKRKDDQISELKISVEKLQKENEFLNRHIERNASLTNALQKGVDSSSKLYEMLESSTQKKIQDFIEKLSEVEKVKLELSETNVKLNKDLHDLKQYAASVPSFENRIQDLMSNITVAERVNVQISAENAKLQQELDDVKTNAASIEPPLQKRILDLMTNLSEAEITIVQTSEKNATLQQELDDAKNYVESPLQKRILDLMGNLSEAERTIVQLSGMNATLQQELDDAKNYTASVESPLQKRILDLMGTLSEAEITNVQMSEKNATLQQELDDAKNYAASVESPLQKRILDLMGNLSEAEIINVQMSEKNATLQQELEDAKNYAASVESPLQKRILDLMGNLSEVEITNVQMSDKNSTLQQELEDAKNYAASVESPLQKRILDLMGNLSEAEITNAQMSEKNATLQQELEDAKNYAASVEFPLQNRIQNLLTNLTKADEVQLEMSEKIRKLEDLVNNWKNYAVNKEQEAIRVEEEVKSLKSFANTMVADLQSQIQNLKKTELKSDGELDEHQSDVRSKNESASDGVLDERKSKMDNKDEVEVFNTDDPIVKECRNKLLKLRFGWIKFYSKKNCKATPGFLHPCDGFCRAQKITSDGYVANTKNIHFGFAENVPDSEKETSQVSALKKFNEKFKTSFV